MTYRLATMHVLQTTDDDRQTDRRHGVPKTRPNDGRPKIKLDALCRWHVANRCLLYAITQTPSKYLVIATSRVVFFCYFTRFGQLLVRLSYRSF